jgi:hypothetical protein
MERESERARAREQERVRECVRERQRKSAKERQSELVVGRCDDTTRLLREKIVE